MPLNKHELKEKIESEGLIQDYIDLETQLTPQGFDLTAGEIYEYSGKGKLDFSNNERKIPASEKLNPERKPGNDYGWWKLEPGAYKVKMNEKVDIPENLMAYAFPRSSLLRMGCSIENAVWDAGTTVRGACLLKVENPEGVEIKENARFNQVVFHRIKEVEEGYSGDYLEI
ncbi:MAG: deoxyuridine 5'-triphosphate nucleotidohydrolase [Candidatus Nanohaloarchaea archaeon]